MHRVARTLALVRDLYLLLDRCSFIRYDQPRLVVRLQRSLLIRVFYLVQPFLHSIGVGGRMGIVLTSYAHYSMDLVHRFRIFGRYQHDRIFGHVLQHLISIFNYLRIGVLLRGLTR